MVLRQGACKPATIRMGLSQWHQYWKNSVSSHYIPSDSRALPLIKVTGRGSRKSEKSHPGPLPSFPVPESADLAEPGGGKNIDLVDTKVWTSE